MNQAIVTLFLDADLTHVSAVRNIEQCRAEGNRKPRFGGIIKLSPVIVRVGFPPVRLICAVFLPIAPREQERKCGDAMAQKICRCGTMNQINNAIVNLTPAQFAAAGLSAALQCSAHIPTDTEMLRQRNPCVNPNRHDPVVAGVTGPVLSAKTDISDCPILVGKEIYPIPAEWLSVLGRPRYEYTLADIVAPAGAARIALTSADRVMLRIGNEVLTGTQFLTQSPTHISLRVDRRATVHADRTTWHGIIAAPLAINLPIAQISKAYPMIPITCQQLHDRYGIVQVDQCIPLYHASNEPIYFENGLTYAPNRASWYAFD